MKKWKHDLIILKRSVKCITKNLEILKKDLIKAIYVSGTIFLFLS